mmetsp:Transcript_34942/g.78956  ORF Transcript_34942/g.78956 Transcript_34942/m.78956 type:complete len:237 (-) Transcript_34942:118-828(-)
MPRVTPETHDERGVGAPSTKTSDRDPSKLFGEILVDLAKSPYTEGDGLLANWSATKLQYVLAVAQGAEHLASGESRPATPASTARSGGTPGTAPSTARSGSRSSGEQRSASPMLRSGSPAGRSQEKGCHKAARYFRKAAALEGDKHALFALGECYLEGDGSSSDPARARGWLEKAAEQGFPPAECRLGTMLLKGQGGPRDVARGYAMWVKAAKGRSEKAEANLATFHDTLAGTEFN